ncbi:mitotic spindle biogenesis protein-like protein Spc19 [Massarina eburnea CBS 473.64]|uniref:DASH complex subunit SPC19 n=1 Tax=Massarina eburnea CBS 473.64 TaxID=1395130 RepID=A0A6A6S7J6_9PLEO|nr:mitotic spindle biogenesis protein-like protein Spc19 [Massarina eburnea CBS 473.64]
MSLQSCVGSLRSSMQLLDSSITVLDEGVNDFPRLGKVLQATRHFELISEPDLHLAQSTLLSEIRPEVESLLSRVQNYLDKLERREQSLIAKSDLNEGRLGASSDSTFAEKPAAAKGSRASAAGGGKPISALQEMKLKQMRAKKQRLSYSVETLELQAKQREKQLRMSMAAPQQFYDDED